MGIRRGRSQIVFKWQNGRNRLLLKFIRLTFRSRSNISREDDSDSSPSAAQ